MPYFAGENIVSQSPIEGGIQISGAQYKAGMDALLSGKLVTVVGGFQIKEPSPPEVEPEPEPGPPEAEDVDAEHDRRATVGRVFEVAGYGSIALEGSLRTQTVLLALKDTARDLQAAGVTDPVLFFTDRDNGDHNLTPDQVVDLVDQGKAYMQALHEAKRAIKAMEAIPPDYADDGRWPAA
ncbi:MAG TPA: hypothetical protein VFY63_02680 [Pseudorhizobium sp.]|nr:hypothetical protein [Pseudorhizobium sp.]